MPHLKKGWVAMDEDGEWVWYRYKPVILDRTTSWIKSEAYSSIVCLNLCFNIDRFDGDWKDSLMKCGEKK